MDHFAYKNRVLHCEDVPVPALAEQYGTPLYVYSTATLLHPLRLALRRARSAASIKPVACWSARHWAIPAHANSSAPDGNGASRNAARAPPGRRARG